MSQISSQGVMLTPGAAAKTARAVRQVLRNQGNLNGQHPDTPLSYQPFWAKLTGESNTSAGHYTWTAQNLSGGTFADSNVLDTNYTAQEANGRQGIAAGAIVKLEWAGFNASNSSIVAYVFSFGPEPYVLFRVALSQNGGANGSQTTPATYTYDVYIGSTSGVKIGTALSVESPRESDGTVTVATVGTAYWNTSGALVLYHAEEVFGSGACGS